MIRLKNNTGGYYSLTLPDSTGMRPDKVFTFTQPNSELNIPDDYAASIGSNEFAYAAYRKGLFTVVNGAEQLEKYFIEYGLVNSEDIKEVKAKIVPDAMLLAALKDGKLAKVEEYINSPNLERLVQLAIDNVKSISREKIEALENATGVMIAQDE